LDKCREDIFFCAVNWGLFVVFQCLEFKREVKREVKREIKREVKREVKRSREREEQTLFRFYHLSKLLEVLLGGSEVFLMLCLLNYGFFQNLPRVSKQIGIFCAVWNVVSSVFDSC